MVSTGKEASERTDQSYGGLSGKVEKEERENGKGRVLVEMRDGEEKERDGSVCDRWWKIERGKVKDINGVAEE